jgi:hypothetical protein
VGVKHRGDTVSIESIIVKVASVSVLQLAPLVMLFFHTMRGIVSHLALLIVEPVLNMNAVYATIAAKHFKMMIYPVPMRVVSVKNAAIMSMNGNLALLM